MHVTRRLACLIATVMAAVAAPAAPARAHSYEWCSAIAPTTTSCTTGTHVRTGDVNHGPFYETGNNDKFTGELESRLVHAGGTRIYRCQIVMGSPRGCFRQGPFPAVGAAFTHNCRTYFVATTTEGGQGQWQCVIRSH